MSSGALEVMIRIAAEAAAVVLDVYRTPFKVEYKGPFDPVTEADRRANDLICERLQREFPGVPVVAEESAPESFANYRASSRVFFVDPVDGTNEFVERVPQFVVMIGFVDGDRATLGVIHAPALGPAWAGEVGRGAFAIDAGGAREPVRVTDTAALDCARLVASRSHRSARLERVLAALGTRDVTAVGSAGLKGVEVARGAADAYVTPYYAGKRWDACAADALVTAAGGITTDAYGTPIDYRADSLSNDRGMVASNGRLHAAILERLEQLRQGEEA